MSDKPSSGSPDGPNLTDRARREAEERRQRQARALRANLGRRKAQGRARDAEAAPGENTGEALENKDESTNRGGA